MGEREERMKETEVRKGCCETRSSGRGMIMALGILSQLWFPAQDLTTTRPAHTQSAFQQAALTGSRGYYGSKGEALKVEGGDGACPGGVGVRR